MIQMIPQFNMTPQYNTVLFNELWPSYNDFKSSLANSLFADRLEITEKSLELTYALLASKYANNPIANNDINQFYNKMFSIIFQYGPTWEKRLDIQKKLRTLSDEEILRGSKAIYNNALNPDGSPATQSLEELPRINSQNTTNYKISRMDAYSQLWELLKVDVTTEYIDKFRYCFKQFVRQENPLLYYEEGDNN